jgi:hypothetical protein
MGHREGNNKAEPLRLDLEQVIETDNPKRVIDAYLLKLYIYGYEEGPPEGWPTT